MKMMPDYIKINKRIILYNIFDFFDYSIWHMNQTALKTFLAIKQTRNLNHAARQLNVTQSTVSARLNALERELGQALFHRKKNGAELTAAGFKFERYARLMTDLWRQAKQETALPCEVEYVCNFGCHPEIWTELGKRFFLSIKNKVPNAALSIWQGEQEELNRWLASGLIDASLSFTPSTLDNAIAQIVQRQRLILVSTAKRQLMRWDPDYVYVDYGENFRQNHAAAYADGDTPMIVFNSPRWALDYLLINGGSAYLPEPLIVNQLASNSLYIVNKAPEFQQTIYLISRMGVTNTWHWMPELIELLSHNSSN